MSTYDLGLIIQAYDAHAEERDANGLTDQKKELLEYVMDAYRKDNVKSILEIGCGPGHAALFVQKNGFDIEGTDISPKMIELVQEKGLPGRVIDCRDIGSIGKTYDAVLSINSLLHVPSEELPGVLRSIASVLKKDGLFALGLWGGEDFEGIYEEDHYEPKRYFVLYSQQTLFRRLTEMYWIEDYRRSTFGEDQFFHRMIMRKR